MRNSLIRQAKRWLKMEVNNLIWRVRGKQYKNPEISKLPLSIMFVCLGNICRSPFSEKLAEVICTHDGAGTIQFSSSGLIVEAPLTSPDEAISGAKEFGVNLGEHLSKGITGKMVESHDMIIAMEPWQIDELKKRFPEYEEKFFLLSLFEMGEARDRGDYLRYHVPDPYGGNCEQFHICFSKIKRCIEGLLNVINEL